MLPVPDFRKQRCIQWGVVEYVKWSKSAALCNPMRNATWGVMEEKARERQYLLKACDVNQHLPSVATIRNLTRT